MSAKNLDRHGRLRSKVGAFRMSEREAEQLDALVAVSGLSKQDYIISKLLDREVVVKPNSRVQKALREQLEDVARELSRLTRIDEAEPKMSSWRNTCSTSARASPEHRSPKWGHSIESSSTWEGSRALLRACVRVFQVAGGVPVAVAPGGARAPKRPEGRCCCESLKRIDASGAVEQKFHDAKRPMCELPTCAWKPARPSPMPAPNARSPQDEPPLEP